METVKNNDAAEVQRLIAEGAAPNAYFLVGNEIDYMYMHVLVFAARENFADVVKLLIDNGADVDAKNDFDKTAQKISVYRAMVFRNECGFNGCKFIRIMLLLVKVLCQFPRGIALHLAAGACVEIVEAGLREFVTEFRNERGAGVEENLRRYAAPCRNPLEHRQDTSDSFRVHLPAEKNAAETVVFQPQFFESARDAVRVPVQYQAFCEVCGREAAQEYAASDIGEKRVARVSDEFRVDSLCRKRGHRIAEGVEHEWNHVRVLMAVKAERLPTHYAGINYRARLLLNFRRKFAPDSFPHERIVIPEQKLSP